MKNNLPPSLIVSILIGFLSWALWSQFVDAPIKRAQGRMQKELAGARELHDARVHVKRLIDEVRAIRGQFAPTAEAEWLVKRLTAHVQEAGLRMESIVPHTPVSVQEFQQVSVTVQLSASYHQLGKLLSQLENSDELVWVQDLDITKPREQPGWGVDATRTRASTLPHVRLTLATLYVPEEIEWSKGRTGASMVQKPAGAIP